LKHNANKLVSAEKQTAEIIGGKSSILFIGTKKNNQRKAN